MRAEDFGDFEKKSVSWVLRSKEEGWLSLARRGLVAGATRVGGWGCREKSQNRKNVYLSPYIEKPLNSKVIKSFIHELRSRKCFSCFGIPMFYVYMLWTFYVRFIYPCIMGMVHLHVLKHCQHDLLYWLLHLELFLYQRVIMVPLHGL